MTLLPQVFAGIVTSTVWYVVVLVALKLVSLKVPLSGWSPEKSPFVPTKALSTQDLIANLGAVPLNAGSNLMVALVVRVEPAGI